MTDNDRKFEREFDREEEYRKLAAWLHEKGHWMPDVPGEDFAETDVDDTNYFLRHGLNDAVDLTRTKEEMLDSFASDLDGLVRILQNALKEAQRLCCEFDYYKEKRLEEAEIAAEVAAGG